MKKIAFIPARYDSSRFPGKPLALIAGKPMIQRVYTCALSCPDISEVVVATDDERIRHCVAGFGGRVVMTGKDHRSGTDRVAEAAEKMNLREDDLVINIQGDQPLFHPDSVSHLLEPLVNDQTVSMSTLMVKITRDNEVRDIRNVKVVTDKNGFALFFSRSPIPFFRDPAPEKAYYKHLGFYGYRMDILMTFKALPAGTLEKAEKLEQLRALENGYRMKVVETPFDSIEVDSPRDIKEVEGMLKDGRNR